MTLMVSNAAFTTCRVFILVIRCRMVLSYMVLHVSVIMLPSPTAAFLFLFLETCCRVFL
jgi:hypothetical protein